MQFLLIFIHHYSLFFLFFVLHFPLTSLSIRAVPSSQTTVSRSKISELKKHLHRFGYLALPENNGAIANFTDKLDRNFELAILRYQSNLGLSVTGNLNSETLSQISTPRCGLADTTSSTNGNFTLHGITTKRRYVFFPGKPRWVRRIPMKLTYAFSPEYTIRYLNRSEIRRAFRQAFSRWSAVIPLSFYEANDYGYADIKIGFYGGDHGDSEPFDGALGVLAHSFSPESGRLHLDAAETWAVDFREEKSPAAIDLESVATHEIGHVLGLAHSSVKEAVMYPSLKPRERKRDLHIDDIHGVQALYGSNPKFRISSLAESEMSISQAVDLCGRSKYSLFFIMFMLVFSLPYQIFYLNVI